MMIRRRQLAALVAFVTLAACDDKPGAPQPTTMNASDNTPLDAGDAAPDVSLKLHDGTSVQLSALRGELVLLWFYPKDDTPG